MGVPLFTIVLESLITKFMGETAAKLRLIFDTMRGTRGVYLFDEFDAIGGHRAAGNDVGEIRRVLNSFLQLLEQDESGSLVIAATNHPQMLDHALFRRFDDVLEFARPRAAQTEQLMRVKLGTFANAAIAWRRVARGAQGLSYAEIARACEDAVKEAILHDASRISTEALLDALAERRNSAKAS
jgi:SpoVK/Ycf46/Vps4 family AAA+-type ATPase